MNQDRRQEERGHVDRRKSMRWELERTLRWRVFRGRRIRESSIIERSLNGLVLGAQVPDTVPVGTRLVVDGGQAEYDRLGFRSAIVRRMESDSDGSRMLIAEIEA